MDTKAVKAVTETLEKVMAGKMLGINDGIILREDGSILATTHYYTQKDDDCPLGITSHGWYIFKTQEPAMAVMRREKMATANFRARHLSNADKILWAAKKFAMAWGVRVKRKNIKPTLEATVGNLFYIYVYDNHFWIFRKRARGKTCLFYDYNHADVPHAAWLEGVGRDLRNEGIRDDKGYMLVSVESSNRFAAVVAEMAQKIAASSSQKGKEDHASICC
jgi:hypothetical protein